MKRGRKRQGGRREGDREGEEGGRRGRGSLRIRQKERGGVGDGWYSHAGKIIRCRRPQLVWLLAVGLDRMLDAG
jgi:hypothetical protein